MSVNVHIYGWSWQETLVQIRPQSWQGITSTPVISSRYFNENVNNFDIIQGFPLSLEGREQRELHCNMRDPGETWRASAWILCVWLCACTGFPPGALGDSRCWMSIDLGGGTSVGVEEEECADSPSWQFLPYPQGTGSDSNKERGTKKRNRKLIDTVCLTSLPRKVSHSRGSSYGVTSCLLH